MKLNETMIERLAAGEIAVKNDGTIEQLEEVIKAAFPDDSDVPEGLYTYYQKLSKDKGLWDCADHTTLPTHPISDFYTEDQPEFVRGEVVEVWDTNRPEWYQHIYLTTIEGALKPYMCVAKYHEDSFKNNDPFETTHWTQIRKLQPKQIEVTRNEIAAWKGCKPEQIVIV